MQNNLREYDYHYYSKEKSGLSQRNKMRSSPTEAKEVIFDSMAKSRKTENKKKKKNKKMHFKYI